MPDTLLRLQTFDDNPLDGVWLMELAATDGKFSAEDRFYTDPEYFSDFADALLAFPAALSAEAIWEIGSEDGTAGRHIRLRVYLHDGLGHAAIEVTMDNRRPAPDLAKAMFHLPCEVAAINRLGAKLKAWIVKPQDPLIWQPETG